MPTIKPFKGILYNTAKVHLADVVAPPYDVISLTQQNQYYDLSDSNIIRLILGREADRYASAAVHMQKWLMENILQIDTQPAFYVLTQTFTLSDGTQVERKGFICACKLEELGKGSVYPHEKTLSKPKEDRFNLFQSVNAMFSQIFSLYRDPEHVLDKALFSGMNIHPQFEVEFEGVVNRVWRLTDEISIDVICKFFLNQNILIADGHHRYETALLYQDYMKQFHVKAKGENCTGNEAFNFVPMFLTNMNDPGLIILPTHRLVHSLEKFNQQELLNTLSQSFTVKQFASLGELETSLQESKLSFGLLLHEAPYFNLLTLKDYNVLKNSGLPEVVSKLDVTILHSLILKDIMGVSEDAQLKKINLDYVKDISAAFENVKSGKAQAAFLMNSTPVEQVREVAEAGYVLPQKSTYFYPKLLSGLVNYSFLQD